MDVVGNVILGVFTICMILQYRVLNIQNLPIPYAVKSDLFILQQETKYNKLHITPYKEIW